MTSADSVVFGRTPLEKGGPLAFDHLLMFKVLILRGCIH
jgi:hypothetical protein